MRRGSRYRATIRCASGNGPTARRADGAPKAASAGRAAITAGCTVLSTSATTPIAQLDEAQTQGLLDEQLLHFSKPKLLIIDELGYLPIEPDAAHVLLQLVSRRYERGSILLTSNRAVSE